MHQHVQAKLIGSHSVLLPLIVVVSFLHFPSAEDAPAADPKSPAASTSEYQLVWSDEFNVDGPPNPANWTFERGFVRNQELQWYQAANAKCADGLLTIEARRERVDNPRFDRDSRDWRRNREFAEYTSASMNTRRKHEWRFGRMELRGRIDVRRGMWPAFWTLGTARAWPGCGEIDIMEFYGNTLLANLAWQGRNGQARWSDLKRDIRQFKDAGWPDKFHVWRMDWDNDFIRLYVDDELQKEVALDTTTNEDEQRANPFREPHYFLLNLAVGANGGDPSETNFPGRMDVDYVRVYQKP